MTDISLQTYSAPIRSLSRVCWIAAILAVALVGASIKVEECRIVPGAFSKAFSGAFDVSRKVCDQSTVAVALAHKVDDAMRGLVTR